MPQLNPAPWLTVMLITWLTLLIVMTKVLNSSPVPHPSTQNLKITKPPLTWPWH
uniref:ATP synthase complex subunit 8 n=1 Tax=Diploderma flaviceps TaxID=52218 RepID=A0A3B1ECE6_9SAUR|nr:ATP synthase F0 subunit 8 [Diploderma flaviceps]ART66033.1 ATPase subunit 8 [Diploderma flaviceps]